MQSRYALLLVVLVPIMNILLNVLISRAAEDRSSFLSALGSYQFLLAYFVVGTVSLTGMLALYFFNRGITRTRDLVYGCHFHRWGSNIRNDGLKTASSSDRAPSAWCDIRVACLAILCPIDRH